MQDMNTVAITGNLTADPELKQVGDTSVCQMRVANNGRKKDQSGQWVDAPNYFNVTVWGAQGNSCAQYLSKGKRVGVTGQLRWREWEAQDGSKRQAVEINANSVIFLSPPSQDGGGQQSQQSNPGDFQPNPNPAGGDFASDSGGGASDDIPF